MFDLLPVNLRIFRLIKRKIHLKLQFLPLETDSKREKNTNLTPTDFEIIRCQRQVDSDQIFTFPQILAGIAIGPINELIGIADHGLKMTAAQDVAF